LLLKVEKPERTIDEPGVNSLNLKFLVLRCLCCCGVTVIIQFNTGKNACATYLVDATASVLVTALVL